jgi:hypothetical protein
MRRPLFQRTLRFLAFSSLYFLPSQSSAQFSYYDVDRLVSVEAGLGGASYFGDLTEKARPLKNVGLAASLGISYSVNRHLRPVFTASLLRISGDDQRNERQNLKARNLRFQSNVVDVSLGLRYHLLKPGLSLLSPYVYGGVGIFHFNPFTTDRTGTKRFLQPLGTEGQRLPGATQAPYKLTQFQVPFGVGLNLIVSREISVALDATFRKIFTDYLDDVSTTYADRNRLAQQDPILPSLAFRGDEVAPSAGYPVAPQPRGNPTNNDLYYTIGLKLIYQFTHKLEKAGTESTGR